nr:hypothetical protein [Hathewaya proteolytica]
MLNIYTNLKCKCCKKELILITEELLSIDPDRYLVCPYCSNRNIVVQGSTDNLRECMGHSSYKKVHGAIRQK